MGGRLPIFDAAKANVDVSTFTIDDLQAAVPIPVSTDAFDFLLSHWEAVSDDHRVQLLLQSLS
jgi:hypothetical protein